MEPERQTSNDPNQAAETTSSMADETGTESTRPALREALVVGFLLVGFLVGGSIWLNRVGVRDPAASSKRVYAQYVGEKSCRECHAGITAQHAKSGHSRTLRFARDIPLAPSLDGRIEEDPESPGTSFRYSFRDGALSTTRTSPNQAPERLLLQYAFGSGHHATTFVTLNDERTGESGSIESRLTVFAEAGHLRLGLTPGQDATSSVKRGVKTPQGRALNPDETRKCFDCHSTVLSDRGPKEIDKATLIPTVSCERCHGPGKAHVDAARRGETSLAMPFGVGRETAELEIKLCGHCHRLPEMAPPGAVRPDNPELARFQPVSLMQSACYKRTQGTMRCTTCHDPHTRAVTNAEGYEVGCLNCHSKAEQKKCGVAPSPRSGCIGCHMPKRDAGQGILFTDHWIRVHSLEK